MGSSRTVLRPSDGRSGWASGSGRSGVQRTRQRSRSLSPPAGSLVEAWPRVLQPVAAGRSGGGDGGATLIRVAAMADASLHPAADIFMLFPYLIVDVYLSCVLVSCVLLFVLYVYLTVRVEPYAAPAAVQYLVLVCVGTQCVPGVATRGSRFFVSNRLCSLFTFSTSKLAQFPGAYPCSSSCSSVCSSPDAAL